jgi:hypothetical protein
VSESTFGPDFHQQFGAHLVEESKTACKDAFSRGRSHHGPGPNPTSSAGSRRPFDFGGSAFGGNRRKRKCPGG